jgi:hypothetical protein
MNAGLVWYLVYGYLRSYRYFPPLLVFLIGLMLLYANRPNPVMESYAASSVLVYFVSAWIGAGFHGAVGDAQEHIAAVHAGSVRAYLAGKTLAVFACGLVLDLAALVYPVAAGSFDAPVRAGEWLTALLAHIELSALGGALGLLLSHPIVQKGTHATAALLLVLILSIVRDGILAEIGEGFAPLFVLLPPAATLVDGMMNPDMATGMRSAAVWAWPLAYGGALCWLYARLAERKM